MYQANKGDGWNGDVPMSFKMCSCMISRHVIKYKQCCVTIAMMIVVWRAINSRCV